VTALTFYDTLPEREWRNCDGSYARRQRYQTVRTAIDLLKQQGLVAPEFMMGMEQELKSIVKEHRDTLKWRRAQDKRRAALRAMEE
jgi:hypothetical protein